jgi:hypothetical protein
VRGMIIEDQLAVLAPRSANRKTRNPPSTPRFHDAGFMESIV